MCHLDSFTPTVNKGEQLGWRCRQFVRKPSRMTGLQVYFSWSAVVTMCDLGHRHL